ncbi:hypothetical protein J2Y86_000154 [Pseudomonas migulae]|uniref:hypothetical protein n=1 Tax=Pseudomonas migulae TaxID=78543 RepID=UPI00209DE975|nr:hypothetical protein [Pseudomonas migulae]MCP1495447.1 hypothetical protein [Pseudomonas migulae]
MNQPIDPEKQLQDGSHNDGQEGLSDGIENIIWSDFWMHARGETDIRFESHMKGHYGYTDTNVYIQTTEYCMSGPHGSYYRANLGIKVMHGGFSHYLPSPDAMWQDGTWHDYRYTFFIRRSWPPQLIRLAILTHFDGPNGGKAFWKEVGLTHI